MLRYEKLICIVVDAYSTGKYFAPAFKGRGYQSIHIQSSTNLSSERFSHHAEDFIAHFIYSGDFEALLNELKNYRIKLCIPGSESGVELADKLSEALGLPSNGTAHSIARRNKYWMGETVSKSGLKTVKQIKSKNCQEIINWAQNEVNQFPIVLKPLDSASGDGVYLCHHVEEIARCHQKILDTPNLFGNKNEEVLAQTFNDGQEYIINTISWEGKHILSEIWRIHKKIGTIIFYDFAEIVQENESEYYPLFEYTKKVLDALNIRYGAGTTEVKYTQQGGAVLLESAARVMGSAPLSFSNELFGFNQLSLMVEAYLNPTGSLEKLISTPAKQHGMIVALISDCSGMLQIDADVEEIKKLVSLHGFMIDASKGRFLKETVDTLTSPGEIYLINSDREALLIDYKKIRQIEADGFYRKAN